MTARNLLAGSDGPPPSVPPASGGPVKANRIRAFAEPEMDLACARLPLTDLGNAERWRVRHGGEFRFCAEIWWFR